MPLRLPRVFHGKIIYATPGSGKTYIADKYDDVIDADELIVQAASEISSGFEPDEDVDDPRRNVSRYMRYIHFSNRLLEKVYDRVEELMRVHTSEGSVVLTGTVRIMEVADYVFISTDGSIIRNGFNAQKEADKVDYLDLPVEHFNGYLEAALHRFRR